MFAGQPVQWKDSVIDSSNNMYCIGSVTKAGGNIDVVLAKFNNAGNPVWSTANGIGPLDVPVTVKLDPDDNPIFLYELHENSTESLVLVRKISKSSSSTLWSHIIDTAGVDTAAGMSVDQYGRIFVAGTSPYNGHDQGYVECVSASGSTSWHDVLESESGSSARSLAVLPSGISFLLTDIPGGEGRLTGRNTNGTLRFSFPVPEGGFLAVEPQGNVCHGYVSGNSLCLERFNSSGGGGFNTLAFNSNGTSGYTVDGIAVDGTGQVFVAGSLLEGTNRNSILLRMLANGSFNVIRAGAPVGLAGNDQPRGLAADPWGNVYITLSQNNTATPSVGVYCYDGLSLNPRFEFTRSIGSFATEPSAICVSKFGSVGVVGTAISGLDSGFMIEAKQKSFRSVAVTAKTYTGGKVAKFTVSAYGSHTAPRTITLSTNSPAFCPVPASVVIPAGSVSATFNVNLTATAVLRGIRVTGTHDGVARSAVFNLVPPDLASVTCNPSSVQGGNSATGAVYLNGPAPAGGWVINLSSSGTNVNVPATVTVTGTSKTFVITTNAVSNTVIRTITASKGSITKTTTLTVTP